jgi:hypothetical protein
MRSWAIVYSVDGRSRLSAKTDPDTSFIFTDTQGRSHSRLGATSMEEYLRCPRRWHYKPRFEPIGLPAPWTRIGTAIHAGLATFYRAHAVEGAHGPLLPEQRDPRVVALEVLASIWAENPELELAAAEKVVSSSLLAAMAVPIPGHIVAVEAPAGDCTPDLVVVGLKGGLEVWDHKWRYRLDDQWADKELRKTISLHQLWHNAMRVQDTTKEPVVAIGKVLISFLPRTKARPFRHEISQARLDNFRQSYQVHRARAIEDHQRFLSLGERPPQNFMSCDDFGGCPYHTLCHSLGGDESQAGSFYTAK